MIVQVYCDGSTLSASIHETGKGSEVFGIFLQITA